ncbi:hypothetical protein HQN90_01750 [Paenibacillus alba]|uniref:hypothetical protein n=1 Tax=Paenibacillus alba TaxID=1197127 RepID=UPI001564DD45|nr:hypothetical protein [Paenibacillus alba]NQX64840.1 hypothetical protein [Paenibacillus alba]
MKISAQLQAFPLFSPIPPEIPAHPQAFTVGAHQNWNPHFSQKAAFNYHGIVIFYDLASVSEMCLS